MTDRLMTYDISVHGTKGPKTANRRFKSLPATSTADAFRQALDLYSDKHGTKAIIYDLKLNDISI